MKFEDIYTPAITPHREDGSIDRDAFVAHLEYLMASGVHGVINGGSTGEYYAQSMEERLEMASLAREVTKGRTHLMVGTVAIRLEDSLTMAEHAAKIGADSVLIGSPPYSVPTERENALTALAIDRAGDLPVMLYNYPRRMGINMGEEFLDRVGRSRNFCAIKESSGDINRVHLLARDWRCCKTLSPKDSHRESMRLDEAHEQAITRPLPHDELVQLHCLAAQTRVAADPLPGNACLHA